MTYDSRIPPQTPRKIEKDGVSRMFSPEMMLPYRVPYRMKMEAVYSLGFLELVSSSITPLALLQTFLMHQLDAQLHGNVSAPISAILSPTHSINATTKIGNLPIFLLPNQEPSIYDNTCTPLTIINTLVVRVIWSFQPPCKNVVFKTAPSRRTGGISLLAISHNICIIHSAVQASLQQLIRVYCLARPQRNL